MPRPDKRPEPRNRKRLLAIAAAMLAVGVAALLVGRADTFDRWAFFGRYPRKWVVLALGFVWLSAGALCAARSRRTVFAFVFANILAGFAVGLIELAGFAGLVGGKQWTGLGYVATPNLDVKSETTGNLVTFLKLAPTKYPIHYVTDARGYRCGEKRATDAIDLWCVGNSFVVAGLVPWKETLTARLEAGLGAKAANVALTGTGPFRQRDMFKTVAPPLTNRLVIQFVFEGNDLKDSRREWTRGANSKHTLLTIRAIDWVRNKSLPPPNHAGTFAGETYHFWETSGDPGGELERVVSTLLEVRDAVKAGGGTYAVAFFPTKLRAMGAYVTWTEGSVLTGYGADKVGAFPTKLGAALKKAGVPFLDLTPALEAGAKRSEALWYTDDTHLNGVGHAVCAKAVLSWDVVKAWKSNR